jgi:hypothetical protein
MFGAQCSTELTNDITHVVAAKVLLRSDSHTCCAAWDGKSRSSTKAWRDQNRMASVVHGLHCTLAPSGRDHLPSTCHATGT